MTVVMKNWHPLVLGPEFWLFETAMLVILDIQRKFQERGLIENLENLNSFMIVLLSWVKREKFAG